MKTIVVLGVGLGSVVVIRQLMRTRILPRDDYKMVVVSPAAHWQWTPGMPRAIVPGLVPDDKIIFPLEPMFKQYPSDKFEFVLGAASGLDPARNSVVVQPGDGSSEARAIDYDFLVIATGASTTDDVPWKALDSTDKTVERYHALQGDIRDAKTVVVAGGGFTGSEVAGELGSEYAKQGAKEVYFIHDHALPLSDLALDSVRKQVRTELERLNVKVVADTKVARATRDGKDTVLELRHADGSTKTLRAQAYVPALGLRPNSGFAPAGMRDARGQIRQDRFLRAEGHDNIFVLGDVGSLERSQAIYAGTQAVHLIKTLPGVLDGGAAAEYKPDPKVMFALTLGRSRGTGQAGTFKLLSILVWWLKGRHMGTDISPELAQGKRDFSNVFEK